MDVLSQKNKRSRWDGRSDSDSDEGGQGPPLDPDETGPNTAASKRTKKGGGEAREAQVSARKSNEKGDVQPLHGGLSSVRREMLSIIRTEEEESWVELDYCDDQTEETSAAIQSILSRNGERLVCKSDLTHHLTTT